MRILAFMLLIFAVAPGIKVADANVKAGVHIEQPTHIAHANGISLAYQDFGDKDSEVILLIMGLGAQLIHWDDDFVTQLVNAGYRVIRFDNRDAGWSQKLYQHGEPGFTTGVRFKLGMSLNAPYKLDDMAADSVGLLDALGIEKAHLVGASMGGMIAQIIAANYPQRTLSLTSIMSTSGAEHLPQGSVTPAERPDEVNRDDAIRGAMAFWQTMGAQRNTQSEDEFYRDNARGFDRSYYPPGFARQLWAILDSGDRVDLLKTIDRPTLVIHGTDDELLPAAGGEHTAELVPDAKLVLIEGMGHYFDDQSKPQIVREILSFIRG